MLLRVRRRPPKEGPAKAQEEEGWLKEEEGEENRLATENRYVLSFAIHPSVVDPTRPRITPTNHPIRIHGR
jgi:hypothetical protein